MKFWLKIGLFSLLAFFVVFNAASVMVIERNHSKLLQQSIDNALNEQSSILSSIDAIVPVLQIYDSIDYEKSVLSQIAGAFVSKNTDALAFVHIANDNRDVIYSNLTFPMPAERAELTDLAADEVRYVLRDIGDRTLLFAANRKQVNGKAYELTYVKDFTAVYAERTDQIGFFLQVDAAACLLYMVAMFLVSRGLTKPIDRMVRTARRIAGGDFSDRVALRSKDELGVLASNFNEMAAVVESKINELELNNREKQRFIDNIAHELKTPLTSIIAYAEYLRVTKYEERTFYDGLAVIHSEARRLEALSSKLMELILLRPGRTEHQLEPRRLSDVVAGIEPALKLKAKEQRLRIVAKDEDGFTFPLDDSLIQMLVLNLVDNAVKASRPGDPIFIELYRREGCCVLEVRDEGTGIEREHLDNIFEPFYMANKSRTASASGAGLGLSICRSIADIHRADIEVSSTVGQGTAVRVVFGEPRAEREVPA